MTAGVVQTHDTAADAEKKPDAWKDHLLIAGLGFGGLMTFGWCAAIIYVGWVLIAQIS